MRTKSNQTIFEIPLKWVGPNAWSPNIFFTTLFWSAIKKRGLLLGLILLTSLNSWAFDSSHSLWNKTLQSHVNKGFVNYQKLNQNSVDLDVYLKSISISPQSDFDHWHKDTQLAFLINLYNAATIRLILDEYPVNSIKDIGFLPHAAWRKKFILLWGKKISLNHLEHEIIRPRSKHLPSVHFALVCAAKGCPPLRSEAYTGPALQKQLQDQGYIFLSNTSKNRITKSEKKLYLSPIFEWYTKDFEQASGSVRKYLSVNYSELFQSELKGFEIRYTRYDWSLNETSH